MKFRVTMKDPDGVYEAIRSAARDSMENLAGKVDLGEANDLIESRHEKISDAISAWVEYGEYLTVEFDTDAKTATVVAVRR